MKKRKTLILMLSLVCLLVVGIGFAAINKQISVKGKVDVNPNTAGFVVEFVEPGDDDNYTLESATVAKIDVPATELINVGDTYSVILTIANNSTDKYNAEVAMDLIDNTNSAIDVETSWGASAKIIEQGKTDTVTVTITLKEAQEEATSFNFTVTFVALAKPVKA